MGSKSTAETQESGRVLQVSVFIILCANYNSLLYFWNEGTWRCNCQMVKNLDDYRTPYHFCFHNAIEWQMQEKQMQGDDGMIKTRIIGQCK